MTRRRAVSDEAGFSLLEVLVALAVLALAILWLLGLRTDGLVTAAEARNLRFAENLASQVLSEIQAGIVKVYDIRGQELTKEELPGFSYKVLLGETEIQEEESLLAEDQAMAADATDQDQRFWERQQWLNERSRVRKARSQGVLVDDLQREEMEVDDTPDEDTFEEIAVFVYYPTFRRDNDIDETPRAIYRLRSRTSTLALSGLTNEQAEEKGGGLTTSESTPKPGSK